MFDYTKAAVRKTIDDFKKLGFNFTILSNLSYISYLIYALATGRSLLAVNIILLAISIAYFLFYLIATKFGKDLDGNKIVKKNVKKALKLAKKLMKVYTFAIMLYGLSSASTNATAPYVIFMALQLMFFLIGVVFDCIVRVVEQRLELFKTALNMDTEPFTKPVKTVGNFFKKLSGKEIEQEPAPTKNHELLTNLVQEQKEEKEKKKIKALFKKRQKRLEKQQNDVVKVKLIEPKTKETAVADTENQATALPEAPSPEPKTKKWFK